MATIKRINDRDPSVVLSPGDFSQGGNGNEYMSTTSRTNRVGASVRITFTGTKITVYGTIDSTALGTAPSSLFSMDGNRAQQFVESQVDHSQYQQRFYTSPDLDPGTHTLLITISEVPSVTASFTLDYADITVVDTPPPSSTAISTTPIPTPTPLPQETIKVTTTVQQQQQVSTLVTPSASPPSDTPSSSSSSSSTTSSVPTASTNSGIGTSLGTIPTSTSAGNGASGGESTSLDSQAGKSSSSSTSKSSTPAIIGGVVGGVVVLLLILVAVFYFLRKKRRASANNAKWNAESSRRYTDTVSGADTDVRPFVGSPVTPSTFIQYPPTSRSDYMDSNSSDYSSSGPGPLSPTASTAAETMIFIPGAAPASLGFSTKAAEAHHSRQGDHELPPPQYEV